MKFLAQGIVIVMILTATAFAQNTRQQLDDCIARVNDEQIISRKLKEEAKKANDENVSLRRERDAAVRDRDQAAKQAEDLRTRNADLDRRNRELSSSMERAAANADNLQLIVNEKDRLATENMQLNNRIAELNNRIAATPAPAAPVETFLYPVSGVLTAKEVQNNVIVADFIFSNNGSRTISSFDSILKFYVQGRKIYEIKLPNVRNQTGAAFSRNETIRFRAGLPITDQNLVNAPVGAIDLVVEVTRIQ